MNCDLTDVGLHCWMLLLSVATNVSQFLILHTMISTSSRFLNIGRKDYTDGYPAEVGALFTTVSSIRVSRVRVTLPYQ